MASEDTARTRELAGMHAFVFEPFTLFRVPPLAGRFVNVSPHGFRDGAAPCPWPPDPDASNVFVFGGSTVFGYEVADAETIPAHLAARLAASLGGRPASVYNFGSPNYASVHERIRLEQLLLDGHVPHTAVFLDGFDEFLWPFYAPVMMRPLEEAIPSTTTRYLSAAARAVGRRLARFVDGGPVPDGTRVPVPDPAEVVGRYLANKRLIEGICTSFEVRPLFVWQPVPCYRYDGPLVAPHDDDNPVRERLLACIRQGYEIMDARRAAGACGAHFLWLADMQAGRTDGLYVDADHYTPAFSREIAEAIASALGPGAR